MASRNGPRTVGTDGSDFVHRERVAPQYKTSSTHKWRLRAIVILHLAMVVLMLLRLSTSILVLAGIRPPTSLQKLRLPRPQTWEYVWLTTGVASILALMSLPRNRAFLLNQYIIGSVVFGICPVLFAMYDQSDDLMRYWNTKQVGIRFLGYPWVVLSNMFLAIVLQVHLFGVYFARALVDAWTSRGTKKKE